MQGRSRRGDGIFYAEILEAVHQFLTISWSRDQWMFGILVLVNYEQLHIDTRFLWWFVAFKKVLVRCTCVYFWIYNHVFCTHSLLSPCILYHEGYKVHPPPHPHPHPQPRGCYHLSSAFGGCLPCQRWLQLIPPIWPWRSLGATGKNTRIT